MKLRHADERTDLSPLRRAAGTRLAGVSHRAALAMAGGTDEDPLPAGTNC
jgi:hypothetical protein